MKKVLIVEQEPILLAILQKRLEAEGWDTLGCSDGLKAKAYILSFVPDLIITNLLIPFYSGQELLLFAKEQPKPIQIIILALFRQEDVRNNLLQLGASAFFFKPFDLEELIQVVAAVKLQNNSLV